MTTENIEKTLDIRVHMISIQRITIIKTGLQRDKTFANGLCNT